MNEQLEELYTAEQKLLNELVSTEEKERTPELKKYQGALKRQIGRLNKQMENLEK